MNSVAPPGLRPAPQPASLQLEPQHEALKSSSPFLTSASLSVADIPHRPTRARWLGGHDARVDALLARMTLDEKIGQMTQGDIGS